MTGTGEMGPQALAAARWWADAIRSPHHDNGDIMFNLLARLPRPEPLDDDQLTAFVNHLSATIQQHIDHNTWTLTLGVDYGPDPELSDAARAAGINTRPLGFPVKTCMWVKPGVSVTVSAGYRAPDKTIWEAA